MEVIAVFVDSLTFRFVIRGNAFLCRGLWLPFLLMFLMLFLVKFSWE